MRPNHIRFCVTFTRRFTANWDSLLAFPAPFLSQVFPTTHTHSHDLSVSPRSAMDCPTSSISCPTTGLSMDVSVPHTPRGWGGLEFLGSHSCSECGPIRAFTDGGTDGLFHSQLWKNLLYLLCRFPCTGDPLIDQTPCRLLRYFSWPFAGTWQLCQ